MDTQHFAYAPLNNQNEEIRLLTLLPGDFDEPIHCQIVTCSLKTSPTYNALSYVWGDVTTASDPRNTVLLDSHSFSVTANLLSALHHLRAPATSRPVTLWVDAVCINQSDVDERSQQVAIMRDIYASAEQVIIWLGEDDEYTSDGLLNKINEIQRLEKTVADEDGKKRQLELMHQCADFYFTLAEVRPWFYRVWILQELAMARNDPLVVCGRRSVPWSTLVSVWNEIAKAVLSELGTVFFKTQDKGDQDAEAAEPERVAKTKLDVLDELLNSRRQNGGETLQRLLILSRTSQSTNPKDRVYALLGLLSPKETSAQNSIPIPIDYRKPTWEVYSDALSHIFSRGKGPHFLSGIYLPGASHPDGLPSWVPDLSGQTGETTTQSSGMQFRPPAHIMGASGVGAECMNGFRLPDKRTLRIEGLFVDVIEEIIPMGKSLGELAHRLPHLEAVVKSAKERHYSHPEMNPDTCLLMDAFKQKEPLWKTLIHGKRWMSGYDIAPDSYEAMHQRLLEMRDHPWGDEYKAENEYELSLGRSVGSRVLFTTKGGFAGTCIPGAQPGDVLSLWFGSPVPFVLRPTGDSVTIEGVQKEIYFLIGASYVGGIMSGEMVDELYCEDLAEYVTDGNAYGLTAAEHYKRRKPVDSQLPDTIVVTIGYPLTDNVYDLSRRFVDLRPPLPLPPGPGPDGNPDPPPAGADNFIAFIDGALRPWVQTTVFPSVKFSRDALFGHSFGGIFAIWALIAYPGLFDTYLIATPTVIWNNGSLIEEVTKRWGVGSSADLGPGHGGPYASNGTDQKDKKAPPAVFLTYGSEEQFPTRRQTETQAEWDERRTLWQSFRQTDVTWDLFYRIQDAGPGWTRDVTLKEYVGQDHAGVAASTIADGFGYFAFS
ncbi:hypothetical protein OQA88_1109 [Cercophora sp. LCS_1]